MLAEPKTSKPITPAPIAFVSVPIKKPILLVMVSTIWEMVSKQAETPVKYLLFKAKSDAQQVPIDKRKNNDERKQNARA